MIVYGACVANEAKYQASKAAILEHCGPSSRLLRTSSNRSIAEAYNELIRQVREQDDVEALVLLHEDVEILEDRFENKLRDLITSRPDVGVIGAIGGRNVTSLKWWQGTVVGRVFEGRGIMQGRERSGDVDSVDGFMLVLTPATFRTLEFDENISGFHGYDFDYCAQTRKAGLAVTIVDVNVAHHSKGGYGNLAAYREANRVLAEKWGQPTPRFARLESWISAAGNYVWKSISPASKTIGK